MISAFLVTNTFLNEYKARGNVAWWPYWKRRVTRLLLPYFAFLLLCCSLYPWHPEKMFGIQNIMHSFLAVHNYIKNPKEIFMPHTWTVAQELHFHFFYSLVVVLLLKHFNLSLKALLKVLVGLAVILLTVQVVLIYHVVPTTSFPVEVLSLDFFHDECPLPVQNYFHHVYMVTHLRLVPYLMGAIVAVLLRVESAWSALECTASKLGIALLLLAVPLTSKFMRPAVPLISPFYRKPRWLLIVSGYGSIRILAGVHFYGVLPRFLLTRSLLPHVLVHHWRRRILY